MNRTRSVNGDGDHADGIQPTRQGAGCANAPGPRFAGRSRPAASRQNRYDSRYFAVGVPTPVMLS
ncbi:hypothetical protein GCM10010151_00590 [Actinoallomurus spadix]|uniref:Uncharacterized protein n=1 Tax=Actinoallomurus spadix TaxID=79912 RepID=A0ABN0VQ17_9ACTN